VYFCLAYHFLAVFWFKLISFLPSFYCEILSSHVSDRDVCCSCVVTLSIVLHMYCVPEYRAVSIYPEDGGSISLIRLCSVHCGSVSLSIFLGASSELYTSLPFSPVRKVLAYWYINLYGLLTYTLAFIIHVHKFVLCSGCLQYGPVF
jgi:hypothetical protein